MAPTLELSAEELQARRRALALEALQDPSREAELEQVEREIASRQRDQERHRLAGEERDRRERAAAAQAEQDRRDAALQRARELQDERDRAARAFDSAARKLAGTVAIYEAACRDQERALHEAGWEQVRSSTARLRSGRLEGALKHWLAAGGVSRGAIELPLVHSSFRRPLAASDARPIEPASTTNTKEN